MNRTEVSAAYPPLGAIAEHGGTRFRLWSPTAQSLELILENGGVHRMRSIGDGYYEVSVDDVGDGATYRIRLDEQHEFPDPAARYQPDGVHGPSMVVDPNRYAWHDDGWSGIPQDDLVFYELHVGTFTPEGSFDGVRSRLQYLKELGVTAVELMPVADFPGRWNWGYDHAALYAPSRAYGTPDDLRRLVDEAHGIGLAVYLDVIYNHLGPDGAYVAAFAPMFTDKHHTPWGQALNLDDEHSGGVRALFIDNALMWLREYHFDGLRLDATHAIVDDSEPHFLAELKSAVESLDEGPKRILIAEDGRNLNRLVLPREAGGYGLDGVWTDDLHHQIRNATAGDEEGYFIDFADTTAPDIVRTIRQGWFYEGQRSRYSGEPRGSDASDVRLTQCVVCIQNHDQVGNRPTGDRLNHDVDPSAYRAVSALLLFVPELPLLFMGQEWAASTPFQFFTDHNEELGSKVSEGRKKEFENFSGFQGEVPDPQDETTFRRSRLEWEEIDEPQHAQILALYRDLLNLRRDLPSDVDAVADGPYVVHVRRGSYELLLALEAGVETSIPQNAHVLIDTENERYASDGTSPRISGAAVAFERPSALIFAKEPR